MWMHAIARRGCTDTVRESALEADSGRKIIRHTGELNPRQYCVWIFAPALCQLSYPTSSNDNARVTKEKCYIIINMCFYIVIFVLSFSIAQ